MTTLAEGRLYKPTRSPRLRPDFDPSGNFVVVRPINLNGVMIEADQPFPKQDVSRRLLRQLYEGGWLTMCAKPVVPRRRVKKETLTESDA